MNNNIKIISIICCIMILTGCSPKKVLDLEETKPIQPSIVPVTNGSSIVINGITSTGIKGEVKEEKKSAVKVIKDNQGSYLGVMDSDVIPSICDATDKKYVYIGDAINGFGVIETTKDYLAKMYKELAKETIEKQGGAFKVESIDQLEKDAVEVLKAISSNNKVSSNMFITYSGNNDFKSTAFDNHIGKSSKTKGAASSGIYDTKGHFEEAGLALEMTNFNVEKVIGGEFAAKFGYIAVIVSADTKCVKNDGIYEALSWIPKAGESQNIKYALQFWADCGDGSLHEVFMEDLSIVK